MAIKMGIRHASCLKRLMSVIKTESDMAAIVLNGRKHSFLYVSLASTGK